jgi:hypothetical protein
MMMIICGGYVAHLPIPGLRRSHVHLSSAKEGTSVAGMNTTIGEYLRYGEIRGSASTGRPFWGSPGKRFQEVLR